MIGDRNNRLISFDEARNIASVVIDHERHHYWFSDGIHERLAKAAWGHPLKQAADAMELIMAGERCVPLTDDPHDGFDPRLVAKQTVATVSVPAPVSDPKHLSFPNLSVPADAIEPIIPNTYVYSRGPGYIV